MVRSEEFKKKVYEEQIKCASCKKPLIAKVMLNVFSEHFELVCINCGFGLMIFRNGN